MNSPEQFAGMLIREKMPSLLLNEVVAIYSGEVKTMLFVSGI